MNLKKFQEKNKKKNQIVIFTIVCIILITGVFLYQSYALFEVKDNFNVVSGNIENPGDLYFAYYIDNEISLEMPKKGSGYTLDEKSNCSNGVKVSWDYENWIARLDYSNYKINNKSKTRCNFYFKEKDEYSEPILNGMDPVLKDELIPVTVDSNGTVHKADTKTEWYKYENKEWANAVILKDETKNYQSNEIIPEDNIESYFVWIPKYRYQLWDLGNYAGLTKVDTSKIHEIPVIFGDYNTTDSVSGECTTPMTSGNIGNCEVGDYMTHPAFLSIPSNGFWVGKFETSKSNSNPDNSINPKGIQIKPNKVSWRNINVGNMFNTSHEYKRNLDSHMMKNTEWGAVAYLQHSAYGSQSSVRFNNNSVFLTGYASINEPTCGGTGDNRDCKKYGTTEDITKPYNTETGVLASTTGNITGIYDMSGGSVEYVAGVVIDESEKMEEKYYDEYLDGSKHSEYTRRILGDATGETGPFESVTYGSQTGRQISSWYADRAYFIFHTTSWFVRGHAYNDGSEAGIFAFSNLTASGDPYGSFRVILTPLN